MAAFSDTSFDQAAFDPGAFAFGTIATGSATPYGISGFHRKKRKKNLYDYEADAVIQPRDTREQPIAVTPTPVAPEQAAPPREPVVVSSKMISAISPKVPKMGKPMIDVATQRKIAAMKLRLRQEIEDEEALLLLGAFD